MRVRCVDCGFLRRRRPWRRPSFCSAVPTEKSMDMSFSSLGTLGVMPLRGEVREAGRVDLEKNVGRNGGFCYIAFKVNLFSGIEGAGVQKILEQLAESSQGDSVVPRTRQGWEAHADQTGFRK